MDILLNDLRYAMRTLSRRPGFVAAVALTLAIAIGANTLVFSLIDSIYLKALPYPNAAALIELNNSYAKSGPANAGVSIPDYLDRREGVPALADSALYTGANPGLSSGGAPERLRGLLATPSLFSTLGVAPQLGRTFTDDEALPPRWTELSRRWRDARGVHVSESGNPDLPAVRILGRAKRRSPARS